mgnify:CR=1 FL=1
MVKYAISVEEQIKKLESRNMLFDSGYDKAKEVLLDIGYYRLGFYWYPFEIDADHNFKKYTKFSDVVKLYYLDVDLRNILLKYLKRIEVNFRTKIIYNISIHYKKDPIWFSNPKYMEPWFISKLDSQLYTKRFIENNKQIKKHHNKYKNDKYAPAWKTFEFLTFGAVVTIFNALKDKNLQSQIANEYNLKKLEAFKNFIFTIKFIRNVCAHSGVVYDLNFPKGINKIPKTKFNNNDNQSLDAGIKTMAYILNTISNNRKSQMENEIYDLFNSYNNKLIRNLIVKKIGYKY